MMSGKMYRFRADDRLDPLFLELWLLSPDAQRMIDAMKTGISDSGLNLTNDRFVQLPVPVPSISEQQQIAAILEDHLSRLHVVEGSLRKNRARLQAVESLLADRLSQPKNADDVVRLDSVSALITDGDHNPPKRVLSGVPHVTAKGIRPDGSIDLQAGTFVTEQGFLKTSRRYCPTEGDVIVTCVGTIGRVAVVPAGIRFSADRNLAAIRLDPAIALPDYIGMALRGTRSQHYIATASGSTAQPHLYLRDLRSLAVHVPPLADQRRRLDQFNTALQATRMLGDVLESAALRCAALRRSLLKDAFSGGLTGDSSNLNVAEEAPAT
jgi:type I restriction enzyme S subunit